VGVEFDHIKNVDEKNWLYQNYEKTMIKSITNSEKYNIHQLLVQTEAFDHYL
jgi:2-oxoglutarate dehydrogenase complex dehydrogenase (E1) component-like enzyme